MNTTQKNIKHALKRLLVFLGLFLVIWVGSYCINSHFGGYRTKPDTARVWQSSQQQIIFEVFLKWQPFFGEVTSHDFTLVGMLYYPLIMLDQRKFHRSLDLTNPVDISAINGLSSDCIHPLDRDSVNMERRKLKPDDKE